MDQQLVSQVSTSSFHLIWVIWNRISAVPPFASLCQFLQGCGFKQWMSNDSKVLMKAFLSAIAGLVPEGMLHAIAAFLDFCYLVWHLQIDESVLDQIEDAVNHFHWECHIFIELGIWNDFLLPHQCALVHYCLMIQLFGLCSSITESKHIKAVKQPYCCSSWNHLLVRWSWWTSRMQNDKLATAWVDFKSHGMLTSIQGNPLPGRWPIHQPQSRSQQPALDEASAPKVEIDEEDVEGVTSEGDVHLPRCPGESFRFAGSD